MDLKTIRQSSCWVVVVLCAMTWGQSSCQAATEKDIQIISKAIHFVEGGIGDEVAVVYDDGVAGSAAEASTVVDLLSHSDLKGYKVSVGALGSTPARVIFITKGLGRSWGDISSVAASSKKLTVTTDTPCVLAGKCILGIQSSPSVEIKISNEASSASGVGFGAAFKMMVKEY